MFDYPFQKPKKVSGAELADWFAANGATYQANHQVDRSQEYIIYGYDDHIRYDEKVKFIEEHKAPRGTRTAWLTHVPSGLYSGNFKPVDADSERLVPKVYVEVSSKDQKEAAKEEKAKLKAEKKIYGNARAVESKNKLAAALTDVPQTAEQLSKAADVSYATATKMLTKMVDNNAATLITGVKEGAPGPGRHYKKVGDAQ